MLCLTITGLFGADTNKGFLIAVSIASGFVKKFALIKSIVRIKPVLCLSVLITVIVKEILEGNNNYFLLHYFVDKDYSALQFCVSGTIFYVKIKVHIHATGVSFTSITVLVLTLQDYFS